MNGKNRLQHKAFRLVATAIGLVTACFLLFIVIHIYTKAVPAEAASSTYYPSFCLGGWQSPQHASGPASVGADAQPSDFTIQNSAFLESTVGSQIFCGYFNAKAVKNAPKKAVITFDWSMAFGDAATTSANDPDSYSTDGQHLVAPATGFNIPNSQAPTTTQYIQLPTNQNQAAASDALSTSAASSTPAQATATTTTDSAQTPAPGAQPATSTLPAPVPQPEGTTVISNPDAEIAPAQQQTAPTPSADQGTSTSTGPQSRAVIKAVQDALLSYLASTANAAEVPAPTFTSGDFLDVSYSFDGIRWTSIGKVNRSNWKGYSVEIPVRSWDDVKHMQVMVSALPTIDEKPDIYLDSIALNVQYSQTVGEIASDGLSAVTDAVDALLADSPDADATDAPAVAPAPRVHPKSAIIEKKLLFSAKGSATRIHADTAKGDVRVQGGNSSMTVSGNCTDAYFVIIVYKNQSDFMDKRNSFIVNQAHECPGKTFRFDLADLAQDIPTGTYYMLTASEGTTGSWTPISDIFPISITSSTTVTMIEQ